MALKFSRSEKEKQLLRKERFSVEREDDKYLRAETKKRGISEKIRSKVPKKALDALEGAFEKGFIYLLKKGGPILEKIGGMDKAKKEGEKYRASLERMVHPATLKALDQAAGSRVTSAKLTVTAEGLGLGAAGIGLPDIPIFLAMLLKTCYEIGASYGYDYKDESERSFTLAILKYAFSSGEAQKQFGKECDQLGRDIDNDEWIDTEINEENLKEVSEVLSTNMLIGKFIQGQAFVGVVGGIQNYQLMHKVATAAKIKYKKRFLDRMILEHDKDYKPR